MDDTDDTFCWQLLAEAIVRQACADYDTALRQRRRQPAQPRWPARCKAHRDFFHSDWFDTLSTLNGPSLEAAVRRYAETPGTVPLRDAQDPLPWG